MVYSTQYGVDRLSESDDWIKLWTRWGRRGAALRYDETAYVGIAFIRCTEEELCAKSLGIN